MNTTLNERLWTSGILLRAGDNELPLQAVDIRAHVDGNGVVWVVTQTFENTLTEAIEAVYSFPLPAKGAASKVDMHIGDRRIAAVIKERNEARIEYEEAVAGGFTAAIVEQDRAEIFTVSVGNIHPGETISIVLTVHDSVRRDGNEASVRMPTLIKNRYVPEGTVDAARITPPRHNGEVHVNSSIEVTFAVPAEDLVCDTVVDAVLSPVAATIADFSLDRDIVLRWTVPSENVDAKWVADADDPTMGTVEVTLRTDKQPVATDRKKKAVSVMLDRSGSMNGWEMSMANQIVVDIVNSLDRNDSFHVLTFDTYVEALPVCEGGMVNATAANKAKLARNIGGVSARGGTDLTGAIEACGAVLGLVDDLEDADDHEKIVVLLTDGAYGDEATAARQREHELTGARVIVVGIGQDMNGYLEILAANGWFTSVSAGHRTGEVSKQVCERISTPAYRNARIETEGLSDQAPRLAPDIYPGAVVELWGRAPKPVDGATVRVVTDSGVLAVVAVRVSDDASATTRWAKSHIDSLDWDVMTGTIKATAGEKQIVDVSVRHSVLSKYTAWIAVDRTRTTETIVPITVVQPSYDDSFDSLGTTHMLSVSLMASAEPRRLSGSMAGFPVPSRSMPDMDFSAGWAWSAPGMDLDELEDIIDRLSELLDRGRDHVDTQSFLIELRRLRTWLDACDVMDLGKRLHGKIDRRLRKMETVNLPKPALVWKTCTELVEICTGLLPVY